MIWRYGVGLMLIVSGCKDAAVISERQETHQQGALVLEPLPMPKAVISHSYQAQQYSSPFAPFFEEASLVSAVADPTVTSITNVVCSLPPSLAPTVLADYPLEELSLRGMLMNGQRRSALIHHPEGGVYPATVGQGVSQQPTQITDIKASSVQLIEYRADGQGCWQTHSTQLALWGSLN